MFALWGENRLKGQRKFVFSYGFTATLITLLILLLVKIFLFISTPVVITVIIVFGLAGTLFGYLVWQRYEKLYQQRLDSETKTQ